MSLEFIFHTESPLVQGGPSEVVIILEPSYQNHEFLQKTSALNNSVA